MAIRHWSRRKLHETHQETHWEFSASVKGTFTHHKLTSDLPVPSYLEVSLFRWDFTVQSLNYWRLGLLSSLAGTIACCVVCMANVPLCLLHYLALITPNQCFPMAHQGGRSKTSPHSLNVSSIPHPQNIPETGGRAPQDSSCLWQNRVSEVGNNENETNSIDPHIPLSCAYQTFRWFLHLKSRNCSFTDQGKLQDYCFSSSMSATRTGKCPEYACVDSSHLQVISEEFMIYYMLPLYWN